MHSGNPQSSRRTKTDRETEPERQTDRNQEGRQTESVKTAKGRQEDRKRCRQTGRLREKQSEEQNKTAVRNRR